MERMFASILLNKKNYRWPLCVLFFITIISLVAFSLKLQHKPLFLIVVDFISVGLMAGLSRALNFPFAVSSIICLGWFCRLITFQAFNWNSFSMDQDGHLSYLQSIIQGGHIVIPKSDQCWQCYHPPLYYFLSAIVHNFFAALFGKSLKYYQLLSLMCSIVSMYYTSLLFKASLEDSTENYESGKTISLIATCMVIFWPSAIFYSTVMNNDFLFQTLYLCGMFHLIKWLQNTSTNKHLFITCVVAALNYWVKSNALLLMIVIIFAFCLKNFKQFTKYDFRNLLLIISLFGLAVLPLFMRTKADLGNYHFVGNQVDSIRRVKGGTSDFLQQRLKIDNSAQSYLSFDLANYFKQPFVDFNDDDFGRNNFWHFLFKTSLWGIFPFQPDQCGIKDGSIYKNSLYSWSLSIGNSLLLMMIIFTFVGFFWRVAPENISSQVLIFNLVLLVIALAVFRYSYGLSPTGDFRYIFPSLYSFIYLFSRSIKDCQSKNMKYCQYFGYSLASIFCLNTIIFYLSLWGFVKLI